MTFQTILKVLGIYSIFLVIFGTIANFMSCIICFRIKNNVTFIFLTYLTLNDIFTLYWWNFNNFLTPFFNIDLLQLGVWVCKIGNFVQFTSLEISAWILVLISFDRFLSIKIKNWRRVYFNQKRAFIIINLLIFLLLGINTNILVKFGYEYKTVNSSVSFCFEVEGFPETQWMNTWGKVSLKNLNFN